jgi:K+-sensing histidine kinase KdpD
VKRQTAIFFYVLSAYVVLQFVWWGFHLIQLSDELASTEDQSQRRVLMIVGEGSVFFLILLFGLWKIRNSIQNDIALSRRQNNFLLSVTHELKTPLATNKLYLQTLLKRTNLLESKKQELLTGALTENKRLEGMIENILTAARLDNSNIDVHKEHINVSERVQLILDKWSKERLSITSTIESGIEDNIDPSVIEIGLINLLENALKYSPHNPQIEVYLKKSATGFVLGVKDQGVGVPDNYRKSIFEKFVRVGNEETRTQKGSGLGLYIVDQLLKMQDAHIECLPNQPQGTHFKITFAHG